MLETSGIVSFTASIFLNMCTSAFDNQPTMLNNRTVLAVAGPDFAVIASDTRLSQGFSIHSRDSPKNYKL